MDAAAKKIQQLYGITLETTEIVETQSDLIRQAQAVLDYWYGNRFDWVHKECKQCHRDFAYRWDSTSIAYCSVTCTAQSLAEIGIKWDPTKPPEERWGKTIPSVVPPSALDILLTMDDTQEVQLDSTSVG